MEFEKLEVLCLHKYPQYLKDCCSMINEEWSRSETARMMSLQASCDSLPTSLILVNDRNLLVGHCKLTRIPSLPKSCFVETVVISKPLRGKKLGTYLMTKVEEYCKDVLKLEKIHLSTKGQENFYAKLGYVVCPPVSIYGNFAIKTEPRNSDDEDKNSMPVRIDSLNDEIPPPPAPPMPTYDSIPTNNTMKSTKTYMFKHLY